MFYLSKSHRKFAASALTAALVVTAAVPASAAGFSDVSDRYKEAVDSLVAEKITQGLTASTYGTAKEIKRVDAAVLIAKAIGMDEEYTKGAKDSGFTDVPDRAKNYINAMKQSGIVNGKTATTFASDQTITRGEAALMLSEAFGLEARTTSAKFTDVPTRYRTAVNALLENKVTSGKTATTFGTGQAITRGEFAIFLHNISMVHTPEFRMAVGSESELEMVLANPEVKEVILLENITALTLPVINRNVKIDLNGKVLNGNLEYKDHTGTEAIELISSEEGGKLQGNLTIDAPKSDFIVGENVEITGKTTIVNVKENTFYNNGVLNSVDIKDNDGVSFANKGTGNVIGIVALNTTGNVKLIGKLDAVEVNQAANITVDASATVSKLNVKAENVVLNAPTGSVETVEAAPGVVVKDPTGMQVETKPTVQPNQPSPTPAKPPVSVNIMELISNYEEKQKAFIAGNFVNEEFYSEHYNLVLARNELTRKLKGQVLTTSESEHLKEIDNALNWHFYTSFEPQVSIYADHIEFQHSDIGVTIEWSSSHPEVINTMDGTVTRPRKGESAVKVILTAKIIGTEETREVSIPMTIEAETNSYTSAASVVAEEWEIYANTNGYFGSGLEFKFDLEEIAKDSLEVQKAIIYVGEGMPDQQKVVVENIHEESSVLILNPIKAWDYPGTTSVNITTELLNADGSLVKSVMNQVLVTNIRPYFLGKLEEEKTALNSESIKKYIPDVQDYSSEELALVLLNFNNLPEDEKTVNQLHSIVEDVKSAQTSQ